MNRRPLWRYSQNDTGGAHVPRDIAVCPECGGELIAQAMVWEVSTGRPIAESIHIDCLKELDKPLKQWSHRYEQNRWQPVRDAVTRWCEAKEMMDVE